MGGLNLGSKGRVLKRTQRLNVMQCQRGNVDRVDHKLTDDRRLTINQIVNAINISSERIENVRYNELGMTKVSARWVVPRLLTPGQEYTGPTISQENQTLLQVDPAGYLEHCLIQDKCWAPHFGPKRKIQRMQ